MKARSFIWIAVGIGIGALALATVALAGPSMSTRWSATTLTKDECIAKGRSAVRAAGFTKNFEVVNTTIFGERGDYTAAVRCASEKEIVFFVVAGPNAKQSSGYNATIAEKFE